MDEKEEDRSDESLRRHLVFYKKLNKTISEIQTEIQTFSDEKFLQHLNDRIEAIELDKTRIRNMFPKVDIETWEDLN
jgi:predicted Zn-dependent peptidase